MEHFGMWGIIPPLLTITLAFVTKDVIVSLFLGILSGCVIAAGGNPALALMNATDLFAASLSDGWNIQKIKNTHRFSICNFFVRNYRFYRRLL